MLSEEEKKSLDDFARRFVEEEEQLKAHGEGITSSIDRMDCIDEDVWSRFTQLKDRV